MGDRRDQEPSESRPAPDTPRHKVTWKGIIDIDGTERPSTFARLRDALFGRGDGGSGHSDPDAGLRRRRRWLSAGLVLVVVAIGLGASMVHIVQPGQVIVPQVFGEAKPSLGEGLHVLLPWPIERTATMSIQTRNYTMSSTKAKGTDPAVLVLGFDGASATVDATVLYRVEKVNATRVYRTVGTNYQSTVVVPSARSCIREAYAGVDLVLAATGELPEISDTITACLTEKIGGQGITVIDFQLRDLTLSPNIQKAVDQKVASDQQVIAAQHDADAQRITAKGQADAAQVLACGGTMTTTEIDGKPTNVVVPNPSGRCETPPLDAAMLSYTYIQALRAIIDSPNSTVILPNGDSGQPIVNVPAAPSGTTTTP